MIPFHCSIADRANKARGSSGCWTRVWGRQASYCLLVYEPRPCPPNTTQTPSPAHSFSAAYHDPFHPNSAHFSLTFESKLTILLVPMNTGTNKTKLLTITDLFKFFQTLLKIDYLELLCTSRHFAEILQVSLSLKDGSLRNILS